MTPTPAPAEWTPDQVAAELQTLAQVVVRLGTVDWVQLTNLDEAPSSGCTRVQTLVNASGMLGALAMAAMVTVEDFFTGMVAAALEGAAASNEGATG